LLLPQRQFCARELAPRNYQLMCGAPPPHLRGRSTGRGRRPWSGDHPSRPASGEQVPPDHSHHREHENPQQYEQPEPGYLQDELVQFD